jgi:hypothetical protein
MRLHTTFVAAGTIALSAVMLAGQRTPSAPEKRLGTSPAHVHISHVMTAWKDTPGAAGLLPVAIADAGIAATHAALMQQSRDLDSMKLHAAHVLHALDPSLEAKGPGSGYGVKRAAAGALEHVHLAAKSEGASRGVQTHAEHVFASLGNVTAWNEQAISTARKIRGASDASEAAALVIELVRQTRGIANGVDSNNDGSIGWHSGEGALAQAQAHMTLMMKGEGL